RELSSDISGSNARVQRPGPAADRVLLAHATGVLSVPLAAGDPAQLTDAAAGVPAAPVVVAGCRYAAWTSGEAWQDCPGSEPVTMALPELGAGAVLSFAVNQGHTVLNDSVGGESWAVQSRGELIDNWESLLIDPETEQEEPQ